MQQTIVFNATFESNTKTSAVVCKESELFNKMVKQCRTLFTIDDKVNIELKCTNNNGELVTINSANDILAVQEVLKHSILPISIVTVEANVSQTCNKFDKKKEKMAKKLEMLKERAEKKQKKIERNRLAMAALGIDKKESDDGSVTRDEIKLQIGELKNRITELKIQLKSLPKEKHERKKEHELKKSQKYEMKLQHKQLKLQKKEERLRVRQARKENRATLNEQWPGNVKHVYIDGDHVLSKFPFKFLAKKGKYNPDQIKEMMLAMNDDFAKKVQSTTPGYYTQVIFANEKKSAVDQMIDIAGALNQLDGLKSCAFICKADDGEKFEQHGASIICTAAWMNLIFDQMKKPTDERNFKTWIVEEYGQK
jgi:hypothetical protein